MTGLEIYKQTQELAKLIAYHNGFQGVVESFSHVSQGRGKTFWDQAVSVQEFLKGHEMYDVISEWEEAHPEEIYNPITDREALIEFGEGRSVWSRSSSGNAQGYAEITDPEYFMQRCYKHCTVYKRGGIQ